MALAGLVIATLGLAAPASATVVTTNADSGAGSLRQAIIDTPASGTVTFDPSVTGTITLATGELPIAKSLTIDGPGARLLSVSGNDASRIFAISGAGVVVTVQDLTLTNGQTPDAVFESGGAVILGGGASLTLQDSAVLNSHAGPALVSDGGGIQVSSGSSLTVRRSLIAGNLAGGDTSMGVAEGGGIELDCCSSQLTLENATIANNRVIGTVAEGGGVSSGGSFSIRNSTIAFNSVDDENGNGAGGGLFARQDSPVTREVQASILASNTVVGGGAGATPDCDTGLFDPIPGDNNVIGDPTECAITGSNNSSPTAAPGLVALANNGGPTDTVALTAASPALNRVTSGCPPPATDQRGLPRVVGSGCESGAFEVQVGLTIDPVSHDYGTLNLGQTSPSLRFTVRNVGDLTANLTTVTTDAAPFTVVAGSEPGRCPVALAPGATCFVDVTFKPGAVGAANATLRVDSSNAGAVQATLAGAGAQPNNPPGPCESDGAAPKVRISSDQRRTLFGVGQLASITTTASDASGLKVNPARKRQKLSTAKAGVFSVRKRATDTCDKRGSATFRYRVVAAPRASIQHMPAPSGCRTRLLAVGNVVSALPLRGAQIFVDGKLKVTGTKRIVRARILTRKLNNGTHRMTLSAVDSLGRRVVAALTFVIRCSKR